MEYLIKGRRHPAFFRFFEEISAIPRGSGNEAGIARYLAAFAAARGLFCTVDDFNNVLIRTPATPGYENTPPLLLQGHTDMVCEKNADCAHDFTKDPLSLYVEDGLLRARGTTLGGDDGAAVALMLAFLDDDTLPHPLVECLFTSGEETSLVGASHFDCSQLLSRRMLNLDTELDGEAIASCAGSADLVFSRECESETVKEHTLNIALSGLAGGHSGADIALGRANAIKLMARLLAHVYTDCPFRLVTLEGGSKRNAIPRECRAQIITLEPERARRLLEEEGGRITAELSAADASFRLRFSRGRLVERCFSYRDSSALLNLILLSPCGVISFSPAKPDFVRTSASMGLCRAADGHMEAAVMARSSCDSEMDALLVTYGRLAKALDFALALDGRSSGWDLNPDSKLAKEYLETYSTLFPDKKPVVNGIHAGLECGIFVGKLPGMDALSVGPTIYDIHSPDEAMDLDSCDRFCDLVFAMIAKK